MRSWPDVSTGRRTRPSFWTSIQDAVDEIEGGEVALPLAGIADALGAWAETDPLTRVLPASAPTRSLSLRGQGTTPYWGPSEVLAVEDFGGRGDGLFDNAAVIPTMISEAAATGSTGPKGATIAFLRGEYLTSAPMVLPRNGFTSSNTVSVIGSGMRSSALVGSSGFPTNRALVEWDATTDRIWYPRFADLRFSLPNVAGVKAIWHKKNAAGTTDADFLAEWMSGGTFERLIFEGSNTYHQVFIDLEVGNRYGRFSELYGDPSIGSAPIYNTILIRTPQTSSGHLARDGGDRAGLVCCTVDNISGMVRRGGYARNFEGWDTWSTWTGGFCNGPRPGTEQYAIHLKNSFSNIYNNVTMEGLGELASWRLESCYNLRFNSCTVRKTDAYDPVWLASHAYALGDRVLSVKFTDNNTPIGGEQYVHVCTTAGTSGGAEPTWATSGTVSDGSVVWTVVGLAAGDGVVMTGCHNILWDGRQASQSSPGFYNGRGRKLFVIDNTNYDITLTNIDIRHPTDPRLEFDVTAGAANRVSISGRWWIDSTTVGTPYAIGAADLRGSGTPEGVIYAGVGSTYRRLDGGTSTSFYVKETGTNDKTGWVAK